VDTSWSADHLVVGSLATGDEREPRGNGEKGRCILDLVVERDVGTF
jgi:hypothetical protein